MAGYVYSCRKCGHPVYSNDCFCPDCGDYSSDDDFDISDFEYEAATPQRGKQLREEAKIAYAKKNYRRLGEIRHEYKTCYILGGFWAD